VDEKSAAVCIINAAGTVQMANKVRLWCIGAGGDRQQGGIWGVG